ncbi:hypothetical protein [Bosea sp. BK604]|uniref:hypothetical protein n=1 Tax=Bosea sp. BK604 TaxID=2512180 RepID=UPI0010465BF5|nr:hypothetical protein [Bosea sp. BK604]TCR65656.1 hypothetical protein EV560_105419 [Bosea sp. BK604]
MMAAAAPLPTVETYLHIHAESPALARMDRAIEQLGAQARLVAAMRGRARASQMAPSTGALRSVLAIRQIVASVLGAQAMTPLAVAGESAVPH